MRAASFLHTHPEEKNVVRLPRSCLWYYKPASQAPLPGWKLMDLLRVFVSSPVLRAARRGAEHCERFACRSSALAGDDEYLPAR
jgi:hypothetical protein